MNERSKCVRLRSSNSVDAEFVRFTDLLTPFKAQTTSPGRHAVVLSQGLEKSVLVTKTGGEVIKRVGTDELLR